MLQHPGCMVWKVGLSLRQLKHHNHYLIHHRLLERALLKQHHNHGIPGSILLPLNMLYYILNQRKCILQHPECMLWKVELSLRQLKHHNHYLIHNRLPEIVLMQ